MPKIKQILKQVFCITAIALAAFTHKIIAFFFTGRGSLSSLSQIKFASLLAAIHLVFYAYPIALFIWGAGVDSFASKVFLVFLTCSAYFACVFVFFTILNSLFFKFGKTFKVILFVLLVANGFAEYFVLNFNTILTRDMMGNVLNTKYHEASSLVDYKLVFYILLFGILPFIFVKNIAIYKSKFTNKLASCLGLFAVVVGIAFVNSTAWFWLDAKAKYIAGLAVPFNYSVNGVRAYRQIHKKPKTYKLLPDTKKLNLATKDAKVLVVLVIGESARMQNFSLYGYGRSTNPLLTSLKLKGDKVDVLQNPTSGATYTSASISHILSAGGFGGGKLQNHEPLPNYARRQGVFVMWHSNNWGEPDISVDSFVKASQIAKDALDDGRVFELNPNGSPYDDALHYNLAKKVSHLKDKDKIFVVLHQAGSHGPLYHQKYSKLNAVFTPACKSVDVKTDCTKDELINSYDNTIVQTDFVLFDLIKELKKTSPERGVVMIYTSDHGESLGEGGFYLHGTPWALAPEFQKKVPIIIWQSQNFVKINPYFAAELKKVQNPSYKPSHDDIFYLVSTALGFDAKSTLSQL